MANLLEFTSSWAYVIRFYDQHKGSYVTYEVPIKFFDTSHMYIKLWYNADLLLGVALLLCQCYLLQYLKIEFEALYIDEFHMETIEHLHCFV